MNDKYLTVTALTKYLKYKFDTDDNLRKVYIKGEISNFKAHTTGHLYFSIKDEGSIIKAIMFASNAKNLNFEPKEGTKVLVTGSISVYPATGNYQIYIDESFLPFCYYSRKSFQYTFLLLVHIHFPQDLF